MKIKDVIQCLEKLAPLALQEDYDNSGLQTGRKNDEVRGVLIGLDCTEAVVREAVRKKCNLIISHHPLVFGGSVKKNSWVERTLKLAQRNRIAIYAIHTNLDNISAGVNLVIAGKLGLRDLDMLLPMPAARRRGVTLFPGMKTGSGMIGRLPKPLPLKSFLQLVRKQMKARVIRHTTDTGRKISRVAICGGSGSFLLNEAMGRKADVLLTADFKYHGFFDAENKIVIADIGHYESEQFTGELLQDWLIENFSIFVPRLKKGEKRIPLLLTGINTNPINYFT